MLRQAHAHGHLPSCTYHETSSKYTCAIIMQLHVTSSLDTAGKTWARMRPEQTITHAHASHDGFCRQKVCTREFGLNHRVDNTSMNSCVHAHSLLLLILLCCYKYTPGRAHNQDKQTLAQQSSNVHVASSGDPSFGPGFVAEPALVQLHQDAQVLAEMLQHCQLQSLKVPTQCASLTLA